MFYYFIISSFLLNGKAGFLFKIGDYKNLSKFILYYSKNKKSLSKKI